MSVVCQESNGTDDAEGTSPRRRRGRSADFTTATPLAVFTLSASPTLVHTAAQGLTSMTGHTSADQLTDNPPEGAVTDPDTQTDTNFTPTSAPSSPPLSSPSRRPCVSV